MSNLHTISESIKKNIFDFLGEIQTTKLIKYDVYHDFLDNLNSLCLYLKNKDEVSKSLISDIYFSIKIIRSEALYFPKEDEKKLGEMADEIQLYLELLLLNDDKESRKPGVPRII